MKTPWFLLSLSLLCYAEESFFKESDSFERMLGQTLEGLQAAERKMTRLENVHLENSVSYQIRELNQQISTTYRELADLISEITQFKKDQEIFLQKYAEEEFAHSEEFEKIKGKIAQFEEQLKTEIITANEKIALIDASMHALGKNSLAIVNLDHKATVANEQMNAIEHNLKGLIAEVTELKANQEATTANPKIYCYRPNPKESRGYAGVEFLWWTTYEDRLFYALSGQVDAAVSATETLGNGSIGTVKSIDFDWKPGYRIYTGYSFRPDDWEIEAIYTYFHDSGHEKETPPCSSSQTLVGTFPQNTSSAMDVAKASIRLNYNQGDLLLARKLLMTDQILTRFLFGATGVWVAQDWNYTYDDVSVTKGEQDWKFYGGGMRIGLDADWFIGKGWSFLTKGTLAILAGTFRESVSNNLNNAGTPTLPSFQEIENVSLNDHRFAYHTQLAFLPAWGKMYKNWGFLIYAGYELNLWFNLHQIYTDTVFPSSNSEGRIPVTDKGLVGFQGLTAGLNFSF